MSGQNYLQRLSTDDKVAASKEGLKGNIIDVLILCSI